METLSKYSNGAYLKFLYDHIYFYTVVSGTYPPCKKKIGVEKIQF